MSDSTVGLEDKQLADDSEMISLDLVQLVKWLFKEKIIIGSVTALFALGSVVYALSLDNIYASDARLVANDQQSNSLSNLAQQFGGGLASFAGFNISNVQGSVTQAALAIEILQSRQFFEQYIFDQIVVDLYAAQRWSPEDNTIAFNENIYDSENEKWKTNEFGQSFKPSVQSAYLKYTDVVAVVKEGSFVTLSAHHISPHIAKKWVELVIFSINDHMRGLDANRAKQSIDYLLKQRTTTSLVNLDEVFAKLIEEQTKTMMLTNVKEDYVFEVVDPPVIAENRSKPDRAMICILYTILGGFLGFLTALAKTRLSKLQ